MGRVLQAAVHHILFVPPPCPVYLLRGCPAGIQGLGLRTQLGAVVSGGEPQLWLPCRHWMLCRSVSALRAGPGPGPAPRWEALVRGWLGP